MARFFFAAITQTAVDAFLRTPDFLVSTQRGKWKPGECNFCGRDDSTTKSAGAIEYPFLVVPGKFSSFYSQLTGEVKICPYCTFASRFAPLALYYSITRAGRRTTTLNAFGLEVDSFLDLSFARRRLSRLVAEERDFQNFPGALKWTQYPLETFTSFIIGVHKKLQEKTEGDDLFKGSRISHIHVISAISSGRTISIDRYYVIPNLPRFLNLISACEWKSKDQQFNAIEVVFNRMMLKRGGQTDTTMREEFARRVFYNNDISGIVEDFLFQCFSTRNLTIKRFHAINHRIFIDRYYTLFLGVEASQLRVARKIGQVLGDVVATNEDKSVLYSIRSSGNKEALVSSLFLFLMRYGDEAGPEVKEVDTLLNELDDSNWRLFKSLIGIYSVLTYLEQKTSKQKSKGRTAEA